MKYKLQLHVSENRKKAWPQLLWKCMLFGMWLYIQEVTSVTSMRIKHVIKPKFRPFLKWNSIEQERSDCISVFHAFNTMNKK